METSEPIDKKLTYPVRERIRFIDLLLFKYGYIKTIVPMDYFGIDHATVMSDIEKYKEFRPDNIVFNPQDEAYYKTLSFSPIWESYSQVWCLTS
ncbi:MAG: hypothetical protein RPU64_03680 [Candidatus Sedimenticola sp. (ex Thyasira tokunagai)]